jgi:hypothetical protein
MASRSAIRSLGTPDRLSAAQDPGGHPLPKVDGAIGAARVDSPHIHRLSHNSHSAGEPIVPRSAQDKRVNSVRQPAGLAQTVSKPSAVLVAVKYARIASSASRLRQNSGRTVMTPRPGQQACALLATEPFTRRGSQAQSLAHPPPFQVLSLKSLKDIEPSILTETPGKQAEQPIRFVTAYFRPGCVGFPAARPISRRTPLPRLGGDGSRDGEVHPGRLGYRRSMRYLELTIELLTPVCVEFCSDGVGLVP